MLDLEFITQEEYESAILEDIEAAVVRPDAQMNNLSDYSVRGGFRAPYFVEEVRQFVFDKYEAQQVFEDGLEIYTTVDMRLQESAERILLKALDDFDEKQRKRLESQGKLEEFIPVSGGLVCIDNRPGYRGFVRAMVGGRDFVKEKYNTITQARRQPGSSIKPFVWAAAVASGLTPSTIVVDAALSGRPKTLTAVIAVPSPYDWHWKNPSTSSPSSWSKKSAPPWCVPTSSVAAFPPMWKASPLRLVLEKYACWTTPWPIPFLPMAGCVMIPL